MSQQVNRFAALCNPVYSEREIAYENHFCIRYKSFLQRIPGFRAFLSISRDFTDLAKFLGPATARNTRSPVYSVLGDRIGFMDTFLFIGGWVQVNRGSR